VIQGAVISGIDIGDGYSSPQNRQKEELALRMQFLVDLWEFENKQALTYSRVAEFLTKEYELGLSRVRWSYLLSGNGYLVTEVPLLEALAKLFGIEGEYLTNLDSPPPPELLAQLEFVQDLRELRVERFAARNLAGVSPETLQLITRAIRDSRDKRKRERGELEG